MDDGMGCWSVLVLWGELKSYCSVQDRKKFPAGEPVFRLASVDLLELDAPTTHLARFLPSLTCGPPDGVSARMVAS